METDLKFNITPMREDTLAELRSCQEEVINNVIDKTAGSEHEFSTDDEAARKISEGLRFTYQALLTTAQYGDLKLMADQLNWAEVRLQHDGVDLEHTLRRFQVLFRELEGCLSERAYRELEPVTRWMEESMKSFISPDQSSQGRAD